MPRFSQPTVCLLGVLALVSALVVWDGTAEPPDASAPSLWAVLERRRELDAQVAVEAARGQRVRELAGDVAAGRLSLLEGAGRLRGCYRPVPGSTWDGLRGKFPGASDDELFCRVTIGQAEASLWADPDRARAVRARLEAELEEHAKNGTLRLPVPGPLSLATDKGQGTRDKGPGAGHS